MCNDLKPYIAYFVSLNFSEGARSILEREDIVTRSRDGKEQVSKATVVDAGEFKRWFEDVKPFIKFE